MGGVTADDLLDLYRAGLFPMADSREDETAYVVDPDLRGVFPLDGLHISRRLARTVRSDRFTVRVDTAFHDVLLACAESTASREGTWINGLIEDLCLDLFARGQAHSVETWSGDRLVGGLYGISIGGAFFGESMFSRERDASKVALVHLAARLVAGGYALLDTQFLTDHLASLGAVEITRDDYHRRLAAALPLSGVFYALGAEACGATALAQLTSQAS